MRIIVRCYNFVPIREPTGTYKYAAPYTNTVLYEYAVNCVYCTILAQICLQYPAILRNRGFPVHHDPPCTGLSQTPDTRMGAVPIAISEVCDNPVHEVRVNWDPPAPAGWRQEEAGPGRAGHTY